MLEHLISGRSHRPRVTIQACGDERERPSPSPSPNPDPSPCPNPDTNPDTNPSPNPNPNQVQRASNTRLVRELRAEVSEEPESIHQQDFSGTQSAESGEVQRVRREEMEQREYEESNFTRLQLSKEAKRDQRRRVSRIWSNLNPGPSPSPHPRHRPHPSPLKLRPHSHPHHSPRP